MKAFAEWVFVCASCGFSRSTLQPGAGRGVDGIEVLRRQNFEILIERTATYFDLNSKRCLEVGSAEGWFLEAMLRRGASLFAIEPSDMADQLADQGYQVTKGHFPDDLPKGQSYDLIVFNDVFEHLDDPVGAIKQCSNHLNEGGVVIINLPSTDGTFYRLAKLVYTFGVTKPFKRMWQFGLPSPHICYFSPNSLIRLAQDNTALKCIDNYSLPSISLCGLKERIMSSFHGFTAIAIYWVLFLASPIVRFLPSDIRVLVFRRNESNTQT